MLSRCGLADAQGESATPKERLHSMGHGYIEMLGDRELLLAQMQLADYFELVVCGDTLPKIAARSEIYGDARQWTRIYDANTEVVGRDRKLRTGLVLLIVKP